MNAARLVIFLVLVLLSGCLAEPYPGVVVGNPEVDEPTTPGKPGETAPADLPDPTLGPLPSDPQGPDGDPSAPGPIEKDPEDTTANSEDTQPPGGDRVGQTPDPEPPASTVRPEHAPYPMDIDRPLFQ